MKQFAGNKPLSTIRRQCLNAGLGWNDARYREEGWDTIRIDCPSGAYVIYNAFNGKFFGKTDDGRQFDSSGTAHDKEPWFQALLSFFYEEKVDVPN